jgi:hypothetical protein
VLADERFAARARARAECSRGIDGARRGADLIDRHLSS